MATADLDTGPPAPDRPRRSAPVARISLATLVRNARVALASVGSDARAVADLRADARGHGAARVAVALLDAAVPAVRVDEETAEALRSVPPAGYVTTSENPTIDTATLFGFPEGMPEAAPALRLEGTVLAVKALLEGEGVSYGYTHRAPRDTRVALVTGGYAQGIVRALGGNADVVIRGQLLPIVGRVAMDVCVIDIGAAPVSRGDRVVFLGDPRAGEPSLSEWAAATRLTPGELATAVGMHAVREHVP